MLFLIVLAIISQTTMSIEFDGHVFKRDMSIFSPQSRGWLGGDVATSIQLSPTRFLWLFGDTLWGNTYKKEDSGPLVRILLFGECNVGIEIFDSCETSRQCLEILSE